MPRSIAIVEDEPLIRANYVEALTRIGYEVRGYARRSEAEAAFAQRMPELVIIDVGLGEGRLPASAGGAHQRLVPAHGCPAPAGEDRFRT